MKHTLLFRPVWLMMTVLCALSGCTVGPDFKRPNADVSQRFGELDRQSSSLSNQLPSRVVDTISPINQWWRTFKDPDLDQLIDNALSQNLDLRVATERIRQARAQRRSLAAGFFPEIDADAGYNRARGSKHITLPLGSPNSGNGSGTSGSSGAKPAATKADPPGDPPAGNDPPTTQGATQPGATPSNNLTPFGKGGLPGVTTELYQVGFDSIWELDIFGGTRRKVETASAEMQAAVENRRDVMITLLAEVARDYLELRGAQQQEAVARENLAAEREVFDLTRSMQKSGLVSELDVSRSAAELATTAATIPPLQARVRRSIHALSTLENKEPNALSAQLEISKPEPTVPPEVPVGLPSELLLRRPDIRRAERQIHAATARVGSAKADLFPKFLLTGSVGLDSSSINHLFDWQSHYFLINPTVTWPIFDAGRIVSNIRLQESVRRESWLQYRNTIMTALREVEDALVMYSTEQQRRTSLAEALAQSRRTLEIGRSQYEHGLADFLTVLDAQRTMLAAQQALTQSDQAVATDLVSLYKALGGGWAQEPPSLRR